MTITTYGLRYEYLRKFLNAKLVPVLLNDVDVTSRPLNIRQD
jgi:hypothetical protein